MTLTAVGAWLMIVSGGLWAGGILIYSVERVDLWARMPVEQYAVDFRRSLRRVDPLMPILVTVAMVGAVIFALTSGGGRAAVLAWIATGLLAIVMVSSILVAEPMNYKFRRVPEGQVPDGAERIRVVWRRFHLIRTLIGCAAFACIAAAIA